MGSSHGYTVSFLSDVVREEGTIFALDLAYRVMRDLLFISRERKNIIPITADANKPDTYACKILPVTMVFQDVSQKNQTQIFKKNCEKFLLPGGIGILIVKAKSIDIVKKSSFIYSKVRSELKKNLEIVAEKNLEPFQKDHCVFVCKKK